MATKTLNTRIQLKYDTLANWTAVENTFKPLKGELCLVEVPVGSTAEQTTPPALLMKVGDGTNFFKDLPWTSALAADVYAWAKKSGIEFETNGTGKFVSSIAWNATNNKITVTKTAIEISDVTGLQDALDALETAIETAESSAVDAAKEYTDAQITAEVSRADAAYLGKNEKAVDADKLDGHDSDYFATASDLTTEVSNRESADTALQTQITANATAIAKETSDREDADDELQTQITTNATAIATEKTRAEGIEAGLRTDVDAKVASVTGENAISVTSGTTPKVTLKINNTESKGNVTLTQDTNGLSANVEIPAATVTGVKSGEKIIGLDGTELTSTLTINYDSTNRKIQLKGIEGALVSEIDASDFIKDGMLYDEKVFKATATTQTVTFPKGNSNEYTGLTVGNQYLALCFTDGAVPTPTYSYDIVDLQNLVDVYTAGDGLTLTDFEFSHTVPSGASAGMHGTSTSTGFLKYVSTDKFGHIIGTDGGEVANKLNVYGEGRTIMDSVDNSYPQIVIKDTGNAIQSRISIKGAQDTKTYIPAGKDNEIVISTIVPVKDVKISGTSKIGDDGVVTLGTAAESNVIDSIEVGGNYLPTEDAVAQFVYDTIGELDVTDITGMSASKTLSGLWETDGKIDAEFQDIAITGAQVTVASATNGHLAGLDANGHIVDSGKTLTVSATDGVSDGTNTYKYDDTALAARVTTLEAKPGLDKVGTVTSVAAGTGLKVTGTATVNPTVEIDDSITFIFNCGSSTTVVA